MATPPRLKRRGTTLTRAWQRTAGGPGTVGANGFIAKAVIVLWALWVRIGGLSVFTDGQSYRERTRTHDLDILLTVLLEVFKETINDSRVSEQIEQQMNAVVLQGQFFGLLHNDVRYPRYMERRKSDVLLELNAKDATMAADKLARLKAFIEGFQQLKALQDEDRTIPEPTKETSEKPTSVSDFKF